MSKLSKYYKVTKQILLEYVADQNPDNSSKVQTKYYIYTGLDNKTYYTEELHDTVNPYINQCIYTRVPDESCSEYMYTGIPKDTGTKNINPKLYNTGNILKELKKQNKIKSCPLSYTVTNMVYDKIKIHLIYGFTLDKLTGFNLQLSVLCSTLKPKQQTSGNHKLFDSHNNPLFETEDVITVNTSDSTDNKKITIERLVNVTEDIILLDLYFPKELLQNAVKWHNTALYQNGAYYDRYIEIDVPSAQYIATNSVVSLYTQNPYGYKHIIGNQPYISDINDNNIYDNRLYKLPKYTTRVGNE